MGLECRNQGGLVAWCPGVLADRLLCPGAQGALPAGRYVAASQARCGPGAALVGGIWLGMAGVYLLHDAGGALGSGLVWARSRSPFSSGCWGPTLGGSSLVSPWCVPWWPWVAGCWRFLWRTQSMGVRLFVARALCRM